MDEDLFTDLIDDYISAKFKYTPDKWELKEAKERLNYEISAIKGFATEADIVINKLRDALK